ncbi:hypothetical protein [Arthrobacter sp. ISL-28]|uniref:hypothetical protein n=1 Tax=Arthrobacter sp. ISL-28 TaxID=2819108 RepID=UPI001BE8EBA6|nr:hypothetical protein [Arthrobacter sp. ISL-28]MBT2519766.1 hypothetical protein [Arthrobacter sp. ISL-28]
MLVPSRHSAVVELLYFSASPSTPAAAAGVPAEQPQVQERRLKLSSRPVDVVSPCLAPAPTKTTALGYAVAVSSAMSAGDAVEHEVGREGRDV